jgi:hypothetical protein
MSVVHKLFPLQFYFRTWLIVLQPIKNSGIMVWLLDIYRRLKSNLV